VLGGTILSNELVTRQLGGVAGYITDAKSGL